MLQPGNLFHGGIVALPTPKRISKRPTYCCRQWLASPWYIRISMPFTGFRMVTSGVNPGALAWAAAIRRQKWVKFRRPPKRQQHIKQPSHTEQGCNDLDRSRHATSLSK